MSKPVVAIIGKPNVGKSTFFNYLIGERRSIVEDTPGVTRDRVYGETNWRGKSFTIIDTGGIEDKKDDVISTQMKTQAEIAIELADVILFMTDVRTGVTSQDYEVAKLLRKSNKKTILVCNKVDDFNKFQTDIYEFYNLGIGDPHPVSAANARGIGDILDIIYEDIKDIESTEDEEKIKVAVIGKPNVGKSTIFNKIIGDRLRIVEDVAGVTRDRIYSKAEWLNYSFFMIDTGGIELEDTPFQKQIRAQAELAIDEADVIIFLTNGRDGVTSDDEEVAKLLYKTDKPVVLAVNKIDNFDMNHMIYDFYSLGFEQSGTMPITK